MTRLLFVCGHNRWRSPTAEAVFARYEGIETQSAGVGKDAETPVSAEAIEWADLILVMEPGHKEKLTRDFGALLRSKRVVVLGIPDEYRFMQPELIALLEERVGRILGLPDAR
ncbi:MAG TPA: low molecular weight protein tyrosine phosphatase family protein [Hypericibacter adhaerens]|uniref:low molecular weight protein tyrosine phosphatase family protein n=1 Tax=Hypericibacter adhaerens TaxID=2602016 RepID=UPI002BBB7FBF|nr:low molecular weight protein tyrosine phosphatase family protein [Hypericibacter adhaerens]HWA44453.1 low molecular weight protein tyrosine phosphatase family protein [Hypericibacter adhaerens]